MFYKLKSLCLVLLTCTALTLAGTNVRAQNTEAACVANAHQLVSAVMSYAKAHDEFLPPTNTMAAFMAALQPYVTNSQVFICPATNQFYALNTAISGATLASITDFGTTTLLQDSQAHSDGGYTVAYLDNYVAHGGVTLTPDQDCATFLGKLVTGIMLYAQDYNNTLPPMQTAAACQQAVLPYTHDSRIFTCPETNLAYAINPTLSNVALSTINDYGTVVVARDVKPHADHIPTVAFLDGHIMRGTAVQPDTETACDTSVKQLVLATLAYVQDHDGVLPPMQTFQQFWTAIYPYVKSSWRSHCPATQLNYAVNPTLSGVNISTIANRATTVFIRDAKLHPNGTKVLGFLDGHIVRQ